MASRTRSLSAAARALDRKRELLDEAVALVARRYQDYFREAERRYKRWADREQRRAEGEAAYNAEVRHD